MGNLSSIRDFYEWHLLLGKIKRAERELAGVKEQEREQMKHIRAIESQIEGMPTDTPDQQIERMLQEQELWMLKKEWERNGNELIEKRFSLEQFLQLSRLEAEERQAKLNPEWLKEYDRLLETKKNPVVEVKKKSCMGCFMPLSTSNFDKWRRGKGLVYCDECERILV
ncbi:C4-type zinc ribbon domain-containing protein [Brevibacillus sp. SKDU10]|uniref:C4-type zinc ribbon domain-containing protein n=1 Tax=Brevibacillus sp. SKDU10 TaxID=1247872 RepID=UPI001E319790|nr:C4-type zinc ribbon domain-containing protein [Brevibacillus sp. SKDU10]